MYHFLQDRYEIFSDLRLHHTAPRIKISGLNNDQVLEHVNPDLIQKSREEIELIRGLSQKFEEKY